MPFSTEQLRGFHRKSNPEPMKCGVSEILSIRLSLTYPFEIMNLLKKQDATFWKFILEIEKITAVKVFGHSALCNHNLAFKHCLWLRKRDTCSLKQAELLPLHFKDRAIRQGYEGQKWGGNRSLSITICWMTRTILEVKSLSKRNVFPALFTRVR